MSTENGKRQRKRATRTRRVSRVPADRNPADAAEMDAAEGEAREHYRREKARRAERSQPPEHPLEQARRAYQALLAADAERAKGGRPKKDGTPPKPKSSSGESDAESED